MPLKLYNTLTRRIEDFAPLDRNRVGLYACGPTVYDFAHIGNLRAYIFEDVLRRSLEFDGYRVKHVMNITDVGHLVSDADVGDDKMMKAISREGLPPTIASLRELADRYTAAFLADLDSLNILRPHVMPKATDHVPQMIAMIETMVEKGFAYETASAVYFDVKKFATYTQLSRQPLEDKNVAVRKEVEADPAKRHPADFALWFKLAGKKKEHVMHWPSPWGEGFPGWHIECSAMSREHLGFPFDIHCGGEDHIGVHHTNEIAQNEAVFGQPAVRWWMHGAFLDLGKVKMAKSAGTFVRLANVVERGIDPLAFRYLCLNTHYRQKLNFSWEALEGGNQALGKLRAFVSAVEVGNVGCAGYEERFGAAISDDLNLPQALGIAWELIADPEMPAGAKRKTLEQFDRIFGFGLPSLRPAQIPAEVLALVEERERARAARDWRRSDELRHAVEALGYGIEDTPAGSKARPRR